MTYVPYTGRPGLGWERLTSAHTLTPVQFQRRGPTVTSMSSGALPRRAAFMDRFDNMYVRSPTTCDTTGQARILSDAVAEGVLFLLRQQGNRKWRGFCKTN